MKEDLMTSIVTYLTGKDWTSPTEIGKLAGKSYSSASGWASPKCKELVALGILERNIKGQYRLKLLTSSDSTVRN